MQKIKDFITYNKIIKNVSNNTLRAYESDITEFTRYITDNDYHLMIKQDIYDYIEFLENKGNGPATRARKISAVKMFFKWLLENEYIEKDITENIQLPKLVKRKPKSFSQEEVKGIIDAVKESKGTSLTSTRNVLIIALLINCGFREFELCNIELSNIDMKDNQIKILGKGGKERVVYFNNGIKALLKEFIEDNRNNSKYAKDSPYLFVSRSSERISERQVSLIVADILEKNGLKKKGVAVHALRKTCATLLYNMGVDLGVIQSTLGHSKMDTTMLYVGIGDEKVKEAGMNLNLI